MKELLFGIFAHPDDEAFGPSASLHEAANNGTDVHLVLVTDGSAGNNPDKVDNLAAHRLKEWELSSKLIGASSSLALHYKDGSLSQNLYHEISDKIERYITKTIKKYKEPVQVSFMTFENGGITGHLDHIAVHYITTFLYLRFRQNCPSQCQAGTLRYYCLPREMAQEPDAYWVYMPPGRKTDEIDERFNFAHLAETKLNIMRAHHSQRDDMNNIILARQDDPNHGGICLHDHFIYFKH